MALQLQLAPAKLKFLQEITYLKRLGEILHFSLGHLLIAIFERTETLSFEVLLNRALAYYPEPLPERERLKSQAQRALEKLLESENWKGLTTLLEGAKALYREPEAYSISQRAFFRPDFLIDKGEEWLLLEFKLREEDLDPEQIDNYIKLLREIAPEKRIMAYIVSLEPFKLNLYKVYPQGTEHEKQGLSHTTQLSLFEKLS